MIVDRLSNLWRSGFIFIIYIYLVQNTVSMEIDLIQDLNHLPSFESMTHHSAFWTLNLTNSKSDSYLSQNATERILKILSANKGFSLCLTLTENASSSGTIFSITYQGRVRFLEIKVSLKRRSVKVLYFPDWKTYGYRTEKLQFPSPKNKWIPMCIEYINKKRELSLNIDCQTVSKVKLKESIPFRSFGDKNKNEFKIWIGQKGSNMGVFKGILGNMIFSDNSRFSSLYCLPSVVVTPIQTQLTQLPTNPMPNRMTTMENELALLKKELAETQKYLKELKHCQCFPQCVSAEGQIKSHGENWIETACRNCTCTLQGKVCNERTCEVLSCSKHVTDIGKCCPRCPYNCQYQKKKYPHNQGFSIGCMDCHCNDGTLSCRRINSEVQCPKLTCPKFLQIKQKGQCCKKCKAFNLCELTKCGPNAHCQESPSLFGCLCKDGYQGNPYQGCVDIDECLILKMCPLNSDCVNLNGTHQCLCKPGFINVNASSNICKATCPKNPCQNNSTCIGPDKCECKAGFTGPSCNIDIDECQLGLIKCPSNSECVNLPGGYICQCIIGYEAVAQDLQSISYNHQCVDTNECRGTRGVHYHCDTSSMCENIPGGYRCIPKIEDSQPFGPNCAIQNQNGDITLLYDRNQQNLVGSCKTCRCQAGTLHCERLRCDCTIDSKSSCCPRCWKNMCDVNERLSSTFVELKSINCSLSGVDCTKLHCPQTKCADAILLSGQCCKYCRSNSLTSCIMAYNNLNLIVPALVEYLSKCQSSDMTYKSGEYIISQRFADRSCVKCLCWDGHLCCGKSFTCTNETSAI